MRLLEGSVYNNAEFSGKDTEEFYKQNLKTQSQDWLWRTKTVHYTLNKQRYRCAEWDNCDWANSILIFGCSMVYGVGVDNSDTVSYQLSAKTNCPVINLGQNGTGLSYLWANTVLLRELNITPKAVIYCWPDRSRQTEFLTTYDSAGYGHWNIKDSWMKSLVTNDTHNKIWATYTVKSIRAMWSCPVIEASWYTDITTLIGCNLLPYVDYARDLAHPGPQTFSAAANIFAEQLI